jgi:hypothetical protein
MEMILQLIFDNQLEHVLYACQLLSVLMLNRILAGAISTLGACSITPPYPMEVPLPLPAIAFITSMMIAPAINNILPAVLPASIVHSMCWVGIEQKA